MKSILSVLASLCVLNAWGATYFVAVSGNDSNPGTQAQPWRTIQNAANRVVAGDIVRVQPGSYAERVSQSRAGSAGRPITFVADGAVVMLGFNISASYIRIVGFEITHSSAVGYPGIAITRANYVEVLDNNIHNTSGTSISPSAASYLTVRGNVMSYPGSPGNNLGSGLKTINDSGSAQTNVLIEYNLMSHNTDFLCSNGERYILRNNVLGPSSTADFGGTPHVDGWQANAQTRFGWMERNWHVDNSVSDSHMILIEAPVSGRNANFSVIKNVSLRSGDQLWFQMRDGTNLLSAHNTVGQIGYGPRGGPGSSGFYYVWSDRNGASFGNYAVNNVYTNVTRGSVYTISSGSSLVHNHDLVFPPATDLTHAVNGDVEADPQFVDYGANNLLLRSTSPARDAGGALTTVTSPSGAGNTFSVGVAIWFYDGLGMTEGQRIYVGNDNNLLITAINYDTGSITVSSSFTWVSGEPVGLAYRGTAPDLGAYEYGDTLLTGASLSSSGQTHTVTPAGDARMVIFYQDGVPHTIDYSPPYQAVIDSGRVSARAYALHPQANPVVNATDGQAERVLPPGPVKVVPPG